MSANIKASTDGTQAVIGVGGGDQMTISNAGVVTANSFVGSASNSNVLATGSTTLRTLANRFSDVVNIKDFGAVGDGVTDDTAAIQAAIDSLGIGGGTVLIPNSMVCLINTELIVKAHVSLIGPQNEIGTAASLGNYSRYDLLKGKFIVNPAITIKMQAGSSIKNLLIYRKGMIFPAVSSLYAGTAITAIGDDISIMNSMILGFFRAFNSISFARHKFNYVCLDNTNGINIEGCFDISYIENVHAWPFAGIEIGDVKRSGTAFRFGDGGDWNKITNCFSYGYIYGFVIYNCHDVTITGCGADNVGDGIPAGTCGFYIDGDSRNIKIINCQSAAHKIAGVYLNTTPNNTTVISNHSSWGPTDHGVLVDGGNVVVNNLQTGLGLKRAVSTTNSNSKLTLSNIVADVTTIPISSTVFTDKVDIKNLITNFTNDPTVNINVKTVAASSGVLNIPSEGEVFYVSGTGFEYLQWGWAGRRVTLVFSANMLVKTSTGPIGVNKMRLTSDFNAAVSQSLTLVHTGLLWYEVSRTL